MDNSKGQGMPSGLEYQYITEDSEVRVYLTPAVKDSILDRITILILKLFFAYSVSYFVSLWIIQDAYKRRGYEAYGGEYILVALIFLVTYGMVNIFFDNFRRNRMWKGKR